jgi:hypothetical protein
VLHALWERGALERCRWCVRVTLCIHGCKRVQRIKREAAAEHQRRLRTARAAADDPDVQRTSMGECTICMLRPCNSAFPCGHMCACYLCALHLSQCPICRRRGDAIRLYPSGPE